MANKCMPAVGCRGGDLGGRTQALQFGFVLQHGEGRPAYGETIATAVNCGDQDRIDLGNLERSGLIDRRLD